MNAVTRWGVAVLGTMTVAGSLSAQPLAVPPGRWWDRPRIAAELGLSDEQRHSLDGVALAHAKTMVDLKAEVEKRELDLRAAAGDEPFDAKRVREAFAVLQQRRTALEQERFELLLKVREVLSAEQWRKLAGLARERLRRQGAGLGSPEGEARPPAPRRF